jgi:hypothetical protein
MQKVATSLVRYCFTVITSSITTCIHHADNSFMIIGSGNNAPGGAMSPYLRSFSTTEGFRRLWGRKGSASRSCERLSIKHSKTCSEIRTGV